MIDLDIDGEYGLQSDKRCYILGRHSTRKNSDGEEVHKLKNKTFHGTLKSALETYAEKRARDGQEIKNFKELKKVWNETNEILKEIESELKIADEQFLKEKQE